MEKNPDQRSLFVYKLGWHNNLVDYEEVPIVIPTVVRKLILKDPPEDGWEFVTEVDYGSQEDI